MVHKAVGNEVEGKFPKDASLGFLFMVVVGIGARLGAPQDRTDPGQQFPGVEGLGQVVVGPDFEPYDSINLVAPRREDDNGQLRGAAQASGTGKAILAWKHQVQNYQVRPYLSQKGVHACAIRYAVDLEPFLFQVLYDQIPQAIVVIDDQNAFPGSARCHFYLDLCWLKQLVTKSFVLEMGEKPRFPIIPFIENQLVGDIMSYSRLKNLLSVSATVAVLAVTTASADTAVSLDADQIRQVVQEQDQFRNAERIQSRTYKMAGEGYPSSAEKIRAREQKRIQMQSRKYPENGKGAFQRGGFGPQSAGRAMASGGGKGGR